MFHIVYIFYQLIKKNFKEKIFLLLLINFINIIKMNKILNIENEKFF